MNPIKEWLQKLFGGASSSKTFASPLPTSGVTPYMTPAPTPTPTPNNKPGADVYMQGFKKYGAEAMVPYADTFAKSQEQYQLPDPYLLAVLSLMETGGGKNMKYQNNPINWGMQNMPDIPYTIDRAASGISGRMPYYKDYLKTKDLADFFKVYTPSSDPANPSNQQLIDRYQSLRGYFQP